MNKPAKWSEKEWVRFEEFDAFANRGMCNDSDENRWYDFVGASHDCQSMVVGEEVAEVMTSRGWNQERSEKYAIKYDDERALLRRYLSTHLVMQI